MKQFTCLADNLYQHANSHFYGLFTIAGRRVKHKLDALSVRAAREEIARKQSDHHRSQAGLCPDPFAPPVTIKDLAEKWQAAGCPDRQRRPRAGRKLETAQAYVAHLVRYFGPYAPEQITFGACDRYHDHRIQQTHKGPGHRTVELELTTLSNLLSWAARSEYCRYNPLASGRPAYRDLTAVRNCSTVMVETDEELHTLAHYLLEDPRSQMLGWQLLLEALTGCRTNEILRLRWDAQKIGPHAAPGYQDDTCLYVARSKRGIFPYILLDAAPGVSPLRDCLRALRCWHQIQHPASPWLLPGRADQHPIDPTSLTHALRRACQVLDLPHRTSHGLRAYHVRALRSLGIDDSEIAKRLGQRSGVALVERVYGRSEPGWFGNKRLDFLPTGQLPAWAAWLAGAAAPNIISLAAA